MTENGQSQSTRSDLNQLLYFQNAAMANESRRTSQGVAATSNSGLAIDGAMPAQLITISNQTAEMTPMGIHKGSKKKRNLKNFSAQSTVAPNAVDVMAHASMIQQFQN